MVSLISSVKILNSQQSVELWDFSKANIDKESRINGVTQVASICYQSPKALNSEVLFNRLSQESIGLPSSSFEFIPVLLDLSNGLHRDVYEMDNKENDVVKYGIRVNEDYWLTNYRAIVTDYHKYEPLYKFDIRTIYNKTEKEIKIIKDNFIVFMFNTDLSTRSQMVRHRVSWQELSRRYVSGKRVNFDFYISKNMKKITHNNFTMEDFISLACDFYDTALKEGIRPEDARRIIPQAMTTKIWGGFSRKQLDNFYKLRLDKKAQYEIREIASAMKNLESFIMIN